MTRRGLIIGVAGVALAGWSLGLLDGLLSEEPVWPEIVEVEVGKNVYAIPHSYIFGISRDKETGKIIRVIMRALWPGLEPKSETNAHLWERRMPKRHITFHLAAKPRHGSRYLEAAERSDYARQDGPFGLVQYTRGPKSGFVPKDQNYRTPLGEPVVFRCFDAPERTKKHFDVEPLCIVDYALIDGAEGIHYTFFQVNLVDWRAIDSAVRALILSFRKTR